MGTSVQCSKFPLPSSPAITSPIFSPTSKLRTINASDSPCRFLDQSRHSSFLFKTGLKTSRSCGNAKSKFQTPGRTFTACLDRFFEARFERKFKEFDPRFHIAGEDDCSDGASESLKMEDFSTTSRSSRFGHFETAEPPWAAEEDEIVLRASVARKANCIDLPLSLRILKRKRQLHDRLRGVGESASCSVKKAFSSMVFIVRELQRYALQMSESLLYRNLQEILDQVHGEMQASFVWLFQQIFSHTPALMVSVMILLANFTVHSMGNASVAAMAAAAAPGTAVIETLSAVENQEEDKLDTSFIFKTFSVTGNPASVQGAGGGGRKLVQPLAGATDGGDGRSEQLKSARSDRYKWILPEAARMDLASEEEVQIWKSVVEEASRLRSEVRDEALDHDTVRMFVSPVTVTMEPEDYDCYLRTELLYRRAVSEEPQNPLLLCNFAQFLYIVARNLDGAEELFKRASGVDPPDAESLLQYAIFLWKARKDLEAAEEMFLRSIEADPHNPYRASNYAGFLFETGGTDTCFPTY